MISTTPKPRKATTTRTFHAIAVETKTGVRLFGRYPDEKAAKPHLKPNREIVVVTETTTRTWKSANRKTALKNFESLPVAERKELVATAPKGEAWVHTNSGNIRTVVSNKQTYLLLKDSSGKKCIIPVSIMATVYRPAPRPRRKRAMA